MLPRAPLGVNLDNDVDRGWIHGSHPLCKALVNLRLYMSFLK
jgi:hypothetical protein